MVDYLVSTLHLLAIARGDQDQDDESQNVEILPLSYRSAQKQYPPYINLNDWLSRSRFLHNFQRFDQDELLPWSRYSCEWRDLDIHPVQVQLMRLEPVQQVT